MMDNRLGLKLNRLTARVRDIDRATAWYRDMLGFTVLKTGTTPNGLMKFAYLRLPGFGISLVQLDLPATEIAPGQEVFPCWSHPVFQVADPNALYGQLRDRGVAVSTRGPAGPGPIRIFQFRDSEGNQLEVEPESDPAP